MIVVNHQILFFRVKEIMIPTYFYIVEIAEKSSTEFEDCPRTVFLMCYKEILKCYDSVKIKESNDPYIFRMVEKLSYKKDFPVDEKCQVEKSTVSQ